MNKPNLAPRRAFALAELLLATGLLALVIGVAMAVLNLSSRSRNVAGAADALQAGTFFQEQFQNDLRLLAPVKTNPIHWVPYGPASTPRKGRISFWVYDIGSDKDKVDKAQLGVKPVIYSLDVPSDKKTAFPMRSFDGKSASVGATPFTSLAFDPVMSPAGPVIRVTVWAARDPESKDNPVVHSFLARIPSGAGGSSIEFNPVADFSPPSGTGSDAPNDDANQQIPAK